jgi:hypothetical protein
LDILALNRPRHAEVQLDVVQVLLFPHQPGPALLPWARVPVYTLLDRGEGGLRASVQARVGRDNRAWDVAHLAAWQSDAEEDWAELVAALGAAAGRQGVLRLVAAVPDEKYLDLFRRVGFTPFAEETILVYESNMSAAVPSAAVRPLQRDDLWVVQRLYTALTPPLVQQAEGSRSLAGEQDEEAWLWPVENGLCAYLWRQHSAHGSCLGLLLDPACREHAPALLGHGLVGAPQPIYLVLRSYQGELLEVARRVGFRPCAEQVLLVKHLAVPETLRQSVPARPAERALGAAPSTPSVGQACAETTE